MHRAVRWGTCLKYLTIQARQDAPFHTHGLLKVYRGNLNMKN